MLIALLEELELFRASQALKTSGILECSLNYFPTPLLFQFQARDYKFLKSATVFCTTWYKLGAVLDSSHLDQKTGFPATAH